MTLFQLQCPNISLYTHKTRPFEYGQLNSVVRRRKATQALPSNIDRIADDNSLCEHSMVSD